jgi:hypothetical protein
MIRPPQKERNQDDRNDRPGSIDLQKRVVPTQCRIIMQETFCAAATPRERFP